MRPAFRAQVGRGKCLSIMSFPPLPGAGRLARFSWARAGHEGDPPTPVSMLDVCDERSGPDVDHGAPSL